MEKNGKGAIDFMYYVSTPDFIQKWNKAKEGELICRMEKAIGGLPQHDSIDSMLIKMDEAGVEKVIVCQCKMWSYRKKWMYMDTQMKDVLQYTKHPSGRFGGMAGYNPFDIKNSVKEVEESIEKHGFLGVYIHIYGFDIPLHDRKMYPLYALSEGLGVPVVMQVGHVLEGMPSEHGHPIYLDQIASDFPDLKMVGAHTGWPWVEELISVCYKWENIYFGADAWSPKYMSPSIFHYLKSSLGRDRCIWGTNGISWKDLLDAWKEVDLKPEVRENLFRENAVRLFGLDGSRSKSR